jgi:uncharacterized protein
MSSTMTRIFGVPKPLIGMVHLPASPGQPRAAGNPSLDEMLAGCLADVVAMQDGGMDGLLFCNENDLPYSTSVGHEVAAWTAMVIGCVRSEVRLPFGVNLLWDPLASIATAAATGASFVREVLCGSYASDMGLLAPDPAEVARTRTRLGAQGVALFANVVPEFATALGGRTVAERARAAAYFDFDALLVSGAVAGVPFDDDDLKAARDASGGIPVLANTGVNHANVARALGVADGVIVGSSLKVDGRTFNPVDAERVRRFVEAAAEVR